MLGTGFILMGIVCWSCSFPGQGWTRLEPCPTCSTLVKMLRALVFFIAVPGWIAAADDSIWDSLLKRYVNTESRVDYAKWKADGTASLDSYLQQLAAPWPKGMSQAAKKAELIDAYNALTVRWILQNYPVESI